MSLPLMVRAIRISIEAVDRGLEDAARTLGAGSFRIFISITLPLSVPGIISGAILGFARSLGEFGATVTFVANIPGETQTLPLALYSYTQTPGAEMMAARLCIVSIADSRCGADCIRDNCQKSSRENKEMIDVKLKKTLGNFNLDVEFSSESTGITVLAGPSGSGKTTIINMISGLLTPDEGRIFINGRLLFDSEKKINCPVEQRRCGYIFQEGRLFPHMNVRKNLLYGRHSDHSRLKETVDLLGIEHLLERMPGNLSGGEKQRVAIGRALLMRPQILLMDEPLASLDRERKEELLTYIDRLPEQFGIPVFYVTHSIHEILRLSDKLIHIKKGRIESSGRPEGEYQSLGISDGNGEYLSVFDCRVKSYDNEFGIISAKFHGGIIRVLAAAAPLENKIRVAIKASNVTISLDRPVNISTTNIFEGTILSLEEIDGLSVLVHCNIGASLTAQVSKASAARLELKPGKKVCLLVKIVSMTY